MTRQNVYQPGVSALLFNVAQWTQLSVVILTEVMSVVSILPPLLFSVVSDIFLWKVIKRIIASFLP